MEVFQMRKVWGIISLAALSLTLSACGRMASTESDESAKITSGSSIQVSDPCKDALQAYYDLLSQENYQNEDADCMKTHFAISDLNADGTLELLVHSTANIMEIDQYYSYENGAAVKLDGPGENEGYTRSIGDLYTLPSRKTFAFFLENPEGNNGKGEFSYGYSLAEYAIEDHQIHMINDIFWRINIGVSDHHTNTPECTLNKQECSLDKIMDEYQLQKTQDQESGNIHFDFPSEGESIKFLPNTDANRRAVCIDSDPAVYALNTYYTILSGEEYKNNNVEDEIMGTHFAISDLNADGTPELLVSVGNNIRSLCEIYTYERKNGVAAKIEIPDNVDFCPVAGSLYPLPSRNSFAYFRGGPAYSEPEHPDDSYMPYTLIEYSIENYQVHMKNHAYWEICELGSKAGSTEYTLNEQECSAEEIIGQYPLKETKNEYGYQRYQLEENPIELLPNTDANRKAIITSPDSDSEASGENSDLD